MLRSVRVFLFLATSALVPAVALAQTTHPTATGAAAGTGGATTGARPTAPATGTGGAAAPTAVGTVQQQGAGGGTAPAGADTAKPAEPKGPQNLAGYGYGNTRPGPPPTPGRRVARTVTGPI